MARAGAIVTVSREGDPGILRGLVSEADRKTRARKVRAASLARSRHVDNSEECSAGDVTATPDSRKAEHSEALERRLSAHRTAALQVEVSRNPTVALATLAHVFVLRVFGDERGAGRTALQVTPSLPGYAMAAAADDLKDSAAWKALEAVKDLWRARLPEDASAWLVWLIGLPQADAIELLTFCTALSVSAMATHGGTQYADAIAEAVGLDMANWWEPAAEGYLSHVSKAQIVKALREAGTDLAVDGIGDMKKEALVAKAVEQLAEKRWLPRSLRPRTVS